MTVIIGFIDKSKVYIGGDRLASNNYYKAEAAEPKVFKKGEFIIGYTSSFRFGEILQYGFNPPYHSKDIETDKEYMVTHFIPEVRKSLEDGKYSKSDADGKSGVAIIGYRNKLYTLQEDWSIIEYLSGVHTTGAGAEYAQGAMSALRNLDMTAENKIKEAIRITSEHCPFVSSLCDVVES